jgi:hypothetical protein
VDEVKLPKFSYYLDESDPPTFSCCAARTARATREGLVEAAKEDYRYLLQVHWLT